MAAVDNKAILHHYAEEIFNQGDLAVIDEIIVLHVGSRTSGAVRYYKTKGRSTYGSWTEGESGLDHRSQ
jgi:hypothetical protein